MKWSDCYFLDYSHEDVHVQHVYIWFGPLIITEPHGIESNISIMCNNIMAMNRDCLESVSQRALTNIANQWP